MRNVARLSLAALVVLTVVILSPQATAETHDTTPSLAQPSFTPAPPPQQQLPKASWLPVATRSAQPADYCIESYFDGECWFSRDSCVGWCTLSCPWGDSQGPC